MHETMASGGACNNRLARAFCEYTFHTQLRAAWIIEQIDKIPLLPFTTGREGAVDPVRNAGGVSHDLGVTLVAGPPEIHGGGGI